MADAVTRRSLVTGAASGIGFAVARRLLNESVDVVAVDIDPRGLESLKGDGATVIRADVTDASDRARITEMAEPYLDYVVNAAGVLRMTPIPQVDEEEWRHVFAVNADAVFFLSQRLAGLVRLGGAIVNISSMAAKTSEPEFAAYCAAKAAVLSITRSFAFELAPRSIRVNAVCPGIIDTPMQDVFVPRLAERQGLTLDAFHAQRLETVPLQRIGSSDEVAAVIWFLLSPEASYMTGEEVNVSAGLVTW